jgi:hypothetical protein
VDELFDGPIAAAAKVHALRVGNAFYGRLQMQPVSALSDEAAGPSA